MQIYLWLVPRNELAGSKDKCLYYFDGFCPLLSMWWSKFAVPLAWYQSIYFSRTFANRVYCQNFGFFQFSSDEWNEHISVCLRTICISLAVNYWSLLLFSTGKVALIFRCSLWYLIRLIILITQVAHVQSQRKKIRKKKNAKNNPNKKITLTDNTPNLMYNF